MGHHILLPDKSPRLAQQVDYKNESLIFLTMAGSSALSGLLFTREGWHVMNWGVIPFLTLAGAATLWLLVKRRAATA